MLRRYGVKIGKHVYISTEIRIDGVPLISIGENCFIGPRAVIGAHVSLHGSRLMFLPVKIGNNCVLGHLSVTTPGCVLEDSSILGAYSGLLPNSHLPTGTTWIGTPARQIENTKYQKNPSNDN